MDVLGNSYRHYGNSVAEIAEIVGVWQKTALGGCAVAFGGLLPRCGCGCPHQPAPERGAQADPVACRQVPPGMAHVAASPPPAAAPIGARCGGVS